MKCTVSSLRYHITVNWKVGNEIYNVAAPGPYEVTINFLRKVIFVQFRSLSRTCDELLFFQIIDGDYDVEAESQVPKLIVPAELNTGLISQKTARFP